MTYKKAEKIPWLDRNKLKADIQSLAEEIRAGEEDVMEDYEHAVQQFADITRSQAPASVTDPVAWDEFCEDWGGDPGETIQPGGKRPMNYLEMVKWRRGYWR